MNQEKYKNDSFDEMSDSDRVMDMIGDLVDSNGSYSETFKINRNGQFDLIRLDNKPVLIGSFIDNSDKLYRVAKEISEKYPQYEFVFDTDTEGSWIKYTISKIPEGNLRVEEGDFVQWESNGIEQFTEPKRIVKIFKGYGFVDGSMSGIPIKQLKIISKKIN